MSYGRATASSCACFWTGERVELLKKLWSEPGLSCRDIANMLGVSRNAVIGKGGRLNLPTRPQVPCAPKAASSPPGPQPQRFPKPADDTGTPLPVNDRDIPLEQRRGLLELTTATCRWPVGDPRRADFFFCGGQAAGGPYCAAHAHRAYTERTV